MSENRLPDYLDHIQQAATDARSFVEGMAKKLLASGVPPRDVAKNLGVSIPTLYRWVPASLQI